MTQSKTARVVMGAAVAAAFFLCSARARASCDEDLNSSTPGAIECAPNAVGNNLHEFLAVIGSDEWGQWIGWLNLSLNECAGWDWIGPVEGFGQDTRVVSMYGNDWFETVAETDQWFCGFPLDPPVTDGHILSMGSGLYSWTEGGGYDTYVSHLASRTNFYGFTLDSAYVWNENVSFMLLSDGGDTVISGGSFVLIGSYAGDDQIISSSPVAWVDCGDGWDMFNGPDEGTNCEYSCPNWPFDC